MSLLFSILAFLFVLSFLVIIHELGHYLTAKLFKVHVEEFGLGYPPRALKLFRVGTTLFSLNWIPFGGFVKMEGEEGEAQAQVITTAKSPHKKPTEKHGEGPFYAKSVFARIVIILTGAFVNFAFGVLAFSLYFSVKGIPQIAPNPRLGEIAQNSPAAQGHLPIGVDILGLKIQDQFIATPTTDDVTTIVNQHLGEKVTIITTGPCQELQCDPKQQEFPVTLRKKEDVKPGQPGLGVRFDPVITQKFYPWPEMPIRGAIYGTQQALFLVNFILQGLQQIATTAVHGQVPSEVSGPVGIFNQANDAGFFTHGGFELLNFAGMLSINLAVMNVLPIPALDGGRALFILLEVIIGKKRVNTFEGYANYAGFAFLLLLITLVTVKDIGSLFH